MISYEKEEMQSEETPFMDLDDEEKNDIDPQDTSSAAIIPRLFAVHLFFFTLYATIFFVVLGRLKLRETTSLHPISDLNLKHIPNAYADFEKSVYSGKPRPELEAAWHSLLEPSTIRVTTEELKLSNQSSVSFPEGGGHMAWLGAFHELHCIKMIRQWIYRDHYHPDLAEEEVPHFSIHADHCLDILRSAAMCHADTTLSTFKWADQAKPMLNQRQIDHKCVDWDELMGSIQHRVVSRGEMGRLVNPLLPDT